MKSILDPTFKYVPSTATDLRETFSRVRREMGSSDVHSALARANNSRRGVLSLVGKKFFRQQ